CTKLPTSRSCSRKPRRASRCGRPSTRRCSRASRRALTAVSRRGMTSTAGMPRRWRMRSAPLRARRTSPRRRNRR
ncbi:MAG: hypothetical protein AVDCRST_MAG71-65, partial [uncultured Lysobacter sp.]